MSLDRLEQGLDPETLADLRALSLDQDKPLIAVDCDEVLVLLSEHIAEFLVPLGYEMRLTQYRLEGTIFPTDSDTAVPFDDCLRLIDRFFHEKTLEQRAVAGAVAALERLAGLAQIVVLTNVPRFAREDRVANLVALGMPYPVVANAGGKGRAMAWLAAQVAAPSAFVDDSIVQVGSVAEHAPETLRVHFAGVDFVRDVLHTTEKADHRAESWEVCERLLRAHLAA